MKYINLLCYVLNDYYLKMTSEASLIHYGGFVNSKSFHVNFWYPLINLNHIKLRDLCFRTN